MESQFVPVPGHRDLTTERLGKTTMQDVEDAVAALRAKGKAVTTRSVFEQIGKGWYPHVVGLLREFRKRNAPVETRDEISLSPEETRGVAIEIERLVKERTLRLTAELDDAREALDAVVQENLELRGSLANADAYMATLRESLAEQTGRGATLRSQIELISGQLENAKLEAQEAKQETALARGQLRALEERCALLASDQALAREEMASLRREAGRAKEEVETQKRECALLQTEVASMQQAQAYLKQSADRAQLLHVELEQARARLSGSEAERTGLAERLADAKESLSRSEATVQQLLGKLLHQLPTDGS